jgi:hypothetical protein
LTAESIRVLGAPSLRHAAMKQFLPTPEQAKRLIIIGAVLLALSFVLRESIAEIALGVGIVLLTLGVLCNGVAELFGVSRKTEGASNDRAPNSSLKRTGQSLRD